MDDLLALARRRSPRRPWLAARVAVLIVTLVAAGCARSPAASPALSSASPAASDASGLVDIGAGLAGPTGLTASVYATGLANAAAFAFDAEGRLWVATAAYSDEGTDGVYLVPAKGTSPLEVIDGLSTPLGLLWYEGSLYVSSADGIVAYDGFDGRAFASSRTILTFPAGTGELNGIAIAPTGRIALGISAPCDSCDPTDEWSAAVVSFLPDGSDLRIEASGIRAPVGLAWYPGTSDLFVTMNQRDDLGEATPGDWLAVVGHGEDWGFPGCSGQGGAECAGTPAPIAVLDKHAAVSGVAIVAGQLGASIGTSALVAEWTKGKVLRVALDRTGSDYAGTVTPFLAGLQNPVAVVAGPDGAVFVSDWGSGIVYRVGAA
jgi:glucose/arabinose dehydrogenase